MTSSLLRRESCLCSPMSSNLPVWLRALGFLLSPFSLLKVNLFYCYFLLASLSSISWDPLCFCYFTIALCKVVLLCFVIFFQCPSQLTTWFHNSLYNKNAYIVKVPWEKGLCQSHSLTCIQHWEVCMCWTNKWIIKWMKTIKVSLNL